MSSNNMFIHDASENDVDTILLEARIKERFDEIDYNTASL
jgi:hypothetical protein